MRHVEVPMRVAYFSEALPPGVDGVARTLSRLVETLHEERIDYRFVSPVVPDADRAPWTEQIEPVASIRFPLFRDYRMALPPLPGLDGSLDRALDTWAPDVVHAVRLLEDWRLDFRLAMVGEGPMLPEIRRRLPRAFCAGQLDGRALARWQASADVLVFPSTTETFANVVLEAFASGLPVVGAAQGGVSSLIQPGRNGLLAQPEDPYDFAVQIRWTLDPARRRTLVRGALATARQFVWRDVNRPVVATYRRLMANPVRAAS
jgi:hypothetical protein